jgi:hypothetical protein
LFYDIFDNNFSKIQRFLRSFSDLGIGTSTITVTSTRASTGTGTKRHRLAHAGTNRHRTGKDRHRVGTRKIFDYFVVNNDNYQFLKVFMHLIKYKSQNLDDIFPCELQALEVCKFWPSGKTARNTVFRYLI